MPHGTSHFTRHHVRHTDTPPQRTGAGRAGAPLEREAPGRELRARTVSSITRAQRHPSGLHEQTLIEGQEYVYLPYTPHIDEVN